MEGAGGRAGGAWYVGLDAGTQGVKCGVWELGVDGCPRAVGRGARPAGGRQNVDIASLTWRPFNPGKRG